MNKKNKILVGCLSLLLVLSVGYALFSETVTINGTATAKGDFDITYTCEVVTKDNASSFEMSDYTKGGIGECKIEDGIIKTISTFSKPGDVVYYKVDITNSGTIPAKLKTVDSSNNYNVTLDDTGDLSFVAGDNMYYDPDSFLVGEYGILGRAGLGVSDSDLENLGFVFQTGQTESLIISHAWSPYNEKELPEEGAVMNYNIILGFEQTTVD